MAKSHKPTRTMSCTCRTDSVLHAFDCAYFLFAVNDAKTMLELFKYERATSNTFRDMVIEQMDEIRNLKAALDYQTQIPNKLNKYKKAIRQLKFDKEIAEQKYDYLCQSHDNVSNNYKNKLQELDGVRCNLFISDHMNKDLEEKCNKLNKQAWRKEILLKFLIKRKLTISRPFPKFAKETFSHLKSHNETDSFLKNQYLILIH